MYQINDGQITVFGYPDGATMAQMQRTLESEHAVKGVVCADNAVIIEGVDSDASKTALYSTAHGAGRTMGRNEAKGTIKPEEMNNWLREKGETLRGGGLDESPQAYKRLPEVLGHHEGTIKILHTLTPVGVAMAGANEFDPYKD